MKESYNSQRGMSDKQIYKGMDNNTLRLQISEAKKKIVIEQKIVDICEEILEERDESN